MTNRLQTLRSVAACITTAGVLALAGCGGGGGDGGPTNIGGGSGGAASGGTIPASALQSSDGFIAYVKSRPEGLSWGSPGQGTHAALIERQGRYAQMWTLQQIEAAPAL